MQPPPSLGAAGYPKTVPRGNVRRSPVPMAQSAKWVGVVAGSSALAGRPVRACCLPSQRHFYPPSHRVAGLASTLLSSQRLLFRLFGGLVGSEAFGWLDSAARARRHACTSVPEVKGEKQSIAMVMADDAM